MSTSLKDRLFFFASEKNYYVYDKFLNSINKVDKTVFTGFKKEIFDINRYSDENQKQVAFFTNQKQPVFSYLPDEKCYVTINLSSSCNMNCSYCFKIFQPKLKKDTLSEIFKYVTEIYYPNAKEYVFSVGYSSEPFLDLEIIDFLDELITKKEGFLFNETDFIFVTPKEVLNKLIAICGENTKKWVNHKKNYIDAINSIIENIDINIFFEDTFLSTIGTFYYDFLKISKTLCKSKRVQLNRRIIEKLFPNKIKIFDCQQYFTICFMTNAFNISSNTIAYIKKRLLKNIYASLDGTKQTHNSQRKDLKNIGTYNKIVKNIKLLQKNGIDVFISCVISPTSFNLIEIFEHFLKLGIVKIDFHYVRNNGICKCFTEETI